MAGCFLEKLRRCLIEQVCQGSKVLSGLNGPEEWILRNKSLSFNSALVINMIVSFYNTTKLYAICFLIGRN